MIADFEMRISDCKNRMEAENGMHTDFGDRAKVISKELSDQFSSDLKSAIRNHYCPVQHLLARCKLKKTSHK